MAFPSTHIHNTAVTLSGVTYARTVEIINGYTIDFEDALLYSTKERRIAMSGDDCYLFNIDKLKKYLEIEDIDFIDEDN
jgi:hypothetical protein